MFKLSNQTWVSSDTLCHSSLHKTASKAFEYSVHRAVSNAATTSVLWLSTHDVFRYITEGTLVYFSV